MPLVSEDFQRKLVGPRHGDLENFGSAIHDGFEQARDHDRRRRTAAGNAAHGGSEYLEGARVGVADSQQPFRRQDEGDVGEKRQVTFSLHHQRSRHVGGTAIRIETA